MSQPDHPIPELTASPRAKQYHRRKIMLSVCAALLEIVFLLVLVMTPLSDMMAEAAHRVSGPFAIAVAVYVLIFLAATEALSFPLSWYRGHRLDRAYGLSRQSFVEWLKDHAKAFGLNAAFTLLLVEILYAFLLLGGRWWWAWTGAVFSTIFIILARLAPVLVFPLFFKFTSLPEGSLRQRIERLTKRANAPVNEVFEMNLSRKSNTVNAALTGIGRSRRVILSDTLLRQFSEDEVEVVVAHELGHHIHRHLFKGILLQTLATFAFLFLVDALAARWANALGYSGLQDLAAMPLLALTAAVMGLLGTPLLNIILRAFERQADYQAIHLTQKPQFFVSTMRRLASLNMADPSPHPLVEFLFYSHPSIRRRIEFCEEYQQGLRQA